MDNTDSIAEKELKRLSEKYGYTPQDMVALLTDILAVATSANESDAVRCAEVKKELESLSEKHGYVPLDTLKLLKGLLSIKDVKVDTYRSVSSVNQNDNMVRVTLYFEKKKYMRLYYMFKKKAEDYLACLS